MNFKERYSYNSQSDLLGEGGFSTIFLATDNLLGRKVALKFFSVTAGGKYSVLNEIRRVINLDHPNIARFHDAVVLENTNVHGEIDKVEIGVMEFMDGGDLKNYLSRNQSTPDQIGKLLYDILLGLEYLHEHNIIHRDLKPQNVLVKNTPKGPVAKLTDFGISKASDAGTQTASTLLGSIEYMAPEQFNPAKFGIAGKIGTNVDLWGFGIMTYEILSGVSLFGNRSSGQTTEQVMNNILQREIAETDIAHLPDPWRTVIRMCVIKNANSRAKNAKELLTVIDNMLSGQLDRQSDILSVNVQSLAHHPDQSSQFSGVQKTEVLHQGVKTPTFQEKQSFVHVNPLLQAAQTQFANGETQVLQQTNEEINQSAVVKESGNSKNYSSGSMVKSGWSVMDTKTKTAIIALIVIIVSVIFTIIYSANSRFQPGATAQTNTVVNNVVTDEYNFEQMQADTFAVFMANDSALVMNGNDEGVSAFPGSYIVTVWNYNVTDGEEPYVAPLPDMNYAQQVKRNKSIDFIADESDPIFYIWTCDEKNECFWKKYDLPLTGIMEKYIHEGEIERELMVILTER